MPTPFTFSNLRLFQSPGRRFYESTIPPFLWNVGQENPSVSEIIRITNEQNRTLITNDKDFSKLVFREKKQHKGVILLILALEGVVIVYDPDVI